MIPSTPKTDADLDDGLRVGQLCQFELGLLNLQSKDLQNLDKKGVSCSTEVNEYEGKFWFGQPARAVA